MIKGIHLEMTEGTGTRTQFGKIRSEMVNGRKVSEKSEPMYPCLSISLTDKPFGQLNSTMLFQFSFGLDMKGEMSPFGIGFDLNGPTMAPKACSL